MNRLTLLLVSERAEHLSLLVSALKASNFNLAMARTAEEAVRLMPKLRINAAIVSDAADGRVLRAALKQFNSKVPVFLLTSDTTTATAVSRDGVQSVLYIDLEDELLTHAIAVFLHEFLRPSGSGKLKFTGELHQRLKMLQRHAV